MSVMFRKMMVSIQLVLANCSNEPLLAPDAVLSVCGRINTPDEQVASCKVIAATNV